MFEGQLIAIVLMAVLLLVILVAVVAYVGYRLGIEHAIRAAQQYEPIYAMDQWWSLTAVDVTQHQTKKCRVPDPISVQFSTVDLDDLELRGT